MTTHRDERVVIVERHGDVQVITINRPEARNAINNAVCAGVGDALADAHGDPDVRAGGVFRLMAAALTLAVRIPVNAPLSVQASKRVAYGVDGGVVVDEEPEWARTQREFTQLRKSEDAIEGPLAFAQKRPPVWQAR